MLRPGIAGLSAVAAELLAATSHGPHRCLDGLVQALDLARFRLCHRTHLHGCGFILEPAASPTKSTSAITERISSQDPQDCPASASSEHGAFHDRDPPTVSTRSETGEEARDRMDRAGSR